MVAPPHCPAAPRSRYTHRSESDRWDGRGADDSELARLAAATRAGGLSCRFFRRLLARNREQHFALALDPLLAALRLRRLFTGGLLGADALAQGVHEVDHLGGFAALRRLD